jgi:peptide/nickel transport system permease protein
MISVVKRIMKIIKSDVKVYVGTLIFILLLIFALISFLAPSWHKAWYFLPRDQLPQLSSDPTYWLGTTTNGRSVFWSLARATLNSLIIGLVAATLAAHIGLILGILAGLRSGVIGAIIMMLADVFITIPPLPLHVVLVTIFKEYISLPLLGLIFVIPSSWAWPARQIRALVTSLREREFILTSLLSGNTTRRILLNEIFPYTFGWHLVNFLNTVLFAIGSEAGLAILGLSLMREDTLGMMIYWIIYFNPLYRGIWWWVIPPIVVLILIFVSLYLISTGLQDYFNLRFKR